MDIQRDIQENAGGIARLLFAEWNSQLNYIANGFAEFMQSISWNYLEFSRNSLKFNENFKKKSEGNLFELSLSGFFPKSRADIYVQFSSMLNKRFVIGFQDNNAQWIFVGDRNLGVSFGCNTVIEDKYSGKNGYEFEFSGNFRTKQPHFIYEEQGITINNALLANAGVYLNYGGGILLYT